MKKLKLGLIGLSEGNGHPYSWAAIINGYHSSIMNECPFPIIPKYLANEKFPEAKILDAEITHIWTQDINLSHHIARATYIPHVALHMEEMIPHVDAVLLARDDAENHVIMSKPFLAAGLPIYIDKPLSLTCKDAKLLFSLQKYEGQLFTCSAFKYAKELEVIKKIVPKEKISKIDACIKNNWNKYAIHLLDPIISILGSYYPNKLIAAEKNNYLSYASFLINNISINLTVFSEKMVKPTIHFMYEEKITSLFFEDTFYAFKSALQHFILGIKHKIIYTEKNDVLQCVEMLEKANIAFKVKQNEQQHLIL